MNIQEARAYIQEIQVGAKIKPGLETIGILLKYLGNPQNKLRFIHVAGTNGKGSTATFISSVLAESGLKVGRYVSPAVFSENEKVQWMQSGKNHYITDEEFADSITEIRNVINEMETCGTVIPTEFEIETAVAFLNFVKWDCDIVVLEVGMGGRLDATNIIKNVTCSVITPIAMDHMKFLGDTIEEIALEKAGIIKENVPVVTEQKEENAKKCVIKKAKEKHADIRIMKKNSLHIKEVSLKGSIFSYDKYENLCISMTGMYQVENACLAIECMECLKKTFHITEEMIRSGLKKASWRGRFEILSQEPVLVVDGAHNPAGMARFCESVQNCFPNYKKIGIMGVFADKDYKEMCRLVSEVFEKIYTITPSSERGLSGEKLKDELMGYGVCAECCRSMEEALLRAKSDVKTEVGKKDKGVFVFGSLSLLENLYQVFSDVY